MPLDDANNLYDLMVLMLLLSIPFFLAGLWLAYRLVRGHRWRQKEILHTSIAILNTNQAILALLLRAVPPNKATADESLPRPARRNHPAGTRSSETPGEGGPNGTPTAEK